MHVIVSGRVQGVGFRYFVLARAQTLGLSGWVRNRQDGTVETWASGGKETLLSWLEELKKGPPLSRVDDLRSDWDVPDKACEGFSIRD